MSDTRDAVPRPPREPLFNVPWMVTALLILLAAIQGWRGSIASDADDRVLLYFAFVPIRLTALFDAAGVARQMAAWAAGGNDDSVKSAVAEFFLSESGARALPSLLTYALLHGSWTHLGLNAIWLLAFGTPVARRFGNGRFLLFMGVGALAGALTHWALFPFGAVPLVGASAAVSGCMGAAVRFAFQGRGFANVEAERPPALTLAESLRDRRAISFLLAWFVTNVLFGAGSTTFGLTAEPVAWQAHIGGFLAGLLLFPLFDPRRDPDFDRAVVPEREARP